MALAFDGSSAFLTTANAATVSHTPVGVPRGVFLFGIKRETTDTVTSATYGGVAMARVNRAVDAVGDSGSCYLYFLGASIPTGTQNAVINTSGGISTQVVCVTVTAAADTRLAGSGSGKIETDTDDPSITITGISGASYGVAGTFSGQPSEASTTAGSGMTMRRTVDFGTATAAVESSTNPNASGNITIAFTTAGTDSIAMVAAAIEEIPSGTSGMVFLV